ncbi:MAG: lytic transglycosylase domain-containing protein [Longimicrobiaceae bacterium]
MTEQKRRHAATQWNRESAPREQHRRRQHDARGESSRGGLPGFAELRGHPVRAGLVGLAIVGAAAPIAWDSIQEVRSGDPFGRTNPAYERHGIIPSLGIDEQSVSASWRQGVRDAKIRESVKFFQEYDLTARLAARIYDSAIQAEIDPDMAFGLVRAESSFRNSATSYVGAVGLTQLMPATARWMEPGVSTSELRNPEVNLEVGFRYLRYLLDKYDQNERLALLAYNRGPGTVDRLLGRGANPDNGYVERVLYGR